MYGSLVNKEISTIFRFKLRIKIRVFFFFYKIGKGLVVVSLDGVGSKKNGSISLVDSARILSVQLHFLATCIKLQEGKFATLLFKTQQMFFNYDVRNSDNSVMISLLFHRTTEFQPTCLLSTIFSILLQWANINKD